MKKILLFMLLISTLAFGQQARRTMVDINNSSTTVLGSSASFTGAYVDAVSAGRWSSMSVSVYHNHAAGVNGTLTINFSTDGTNTAESYAYTIATDTETEPIVLPILHQWYQVVFANGAEIQTEFRLETILYENDMSISTILEDSTLATSENNSSAIKTAVEIMDDWDDANYANVNMNIAGTDVAANAGVNTAQTQRVTIATDDEVNNSLDLIDDAVYVDDADWTAATSKHVLVGGKYQSTQQTVTDGDVAAIQLDVNGNVITSEWDASLDAARVVNLSPEWARYTSALLAINQTNLDTDSAFAIIDMNGYSYFSIQANASGGTTMKAYITNNASASNTDSDDGNWSDYSTFLFGAASIADPTNLFYIQDTPLTCEKVMIKVVTADASNAIAIRTKRSR